MQRLSIWIIVVAAGCAALGAWLGSQAGDGATGMIALIGVTFGVLGSFLPGSVRRVRDRARQPGGPRRGAA